MPFSEIEEDIISMQDQCEPCFAYPYGSARKLKISGVMYRLKINYLRSLSSLLDKRDTYLPALNLSISLHFW
jgi:hypothetical protein